MASCAIATGFCRCSRHHVFDGLSQATIANTECALRRLPASLSNFKMATTSSYRPAAGQATGQFPQQQQQQPYPSYSRHPLQPTPVPERQTRVELGQRLKERGMVLDGLVVNRFASVPVPRPGEALIQVVCSDASYTE